MKEPTPLAVKHTGVVKEGKADGQQITKPTDDIGIICLGHR